MKRDKIDLLSKILTKMKAAVLVAEVEVEVMAIGEAELLLKDVVEVALEAALEVALEADHHTEVQGTVDHPRAITVKRLAI